ncbi:MAG TPA: hypothetical protein VFT72_13945 [Opitutaceae bacterium]|nr:hypothetical protein [Opitutaceae bacterium]
MAGTHSAARFTLLLAMAAACVLIVAAALLEPVVRGRFFTRSHEERVQVTGLSLPQAPDDDWLVYTNRGTFTVSDELRSKSRHDDPAFLFHIGQSYRIQVKGAGTECFLGTFHPVIDDAQAVGMGLAGGSL